jgi:antitoxin CcdA
MPTPLRKATNLSLDQQLVNEARQLGINLSRACEQGLAVQIAQERRRKWLAENAEAIASSNAYVDKNGLPLAHLRQF